LTFSIGEKLELRKNVSTIDKISLLVRQHYCESWETCDSQSALLFIEYSSNSHAQIIPLQPEMFCSRIDSYNRKNVQLGASQHWQMTQTLQPCGFVVVPNLPKLE
jgi:hypothetical protein